MSGPDPALAPDKSVTAFEEDGAVVLRGVFGDWVEPLRQGVDALMAQPSPLERTVRPADGSAPFFQDLCNWQRIPEFRAFVFESDAARIAAGLMRSRTARFFHDHVLVKQPGTSTVTPWHQDQPYYCVEGRQSVSFWIPLDPVPRDVVMECVRGSHRWGKGFRPMRFDGTKLYADDEFEAMPDIEAMRQKLEIVGWDMEPGDAIAFSFRTVHGAPANRSARPRRVFSARFVGDDAVYAQRAGRGSPPFEGLGLEDGNPFEFTRVPGRLFPFVRGTVSVQAETVAVRLPDEAAAGRRSLGLPPLLPHSKLTSGPTGFCRRKAVRPVRFDGETCTLVGDAISNEGA